MGIDYYRIDTTKPLKEQRHTDAILHKLIDQVALQGDENERIAKWMEQTQKECPDLIYIDSLNNLNEFLKRSYSYEVANKAIHNTHLESILSVPSYFVLPANEPIRENMKKHNISAPILAKPEWTLGDVSSHAIDVYITDKSIPESYPHDMVIQEYQDHNGVIFKVYAIGKDVFLEKRYSLPNTKNCSVNLIDKYSIDHKKKCPSTFSSLSDDKATHDNEIIHDASSETEVFTKQMVTTFITEVESILCMDLLGVDFIIDSKDPNKIYCIDINLFPSYTGVDNVSEYMAKLILKKCGV